ncbi:MAG TPA: restriction endonuclease subunit S [Candidatus Brocadiia bacterium]|nr:restriction endonuclease subunit S [Candidatus Brocadiales bacterium]
MIEKYPLPEDWHWVRLGEAVERIQYGISKKLNSESKGYPIIRMGNIDEGILNLSDIRFVDLSEQEAKKYFLLHGDILINRTNSAELVGKSAVFTEQDNYVFASYLIRLKVKYSEVEPYFLNYIINSFIGRNYVARVARRAIGQVNINSKEISAMEVPLPPLPEQKRIATKIQELMQEVERARNACERRLEAAKALPAAYLRQVFESEEAKKWERKRLGETLEIIESGSRPKGGVFEIKEGIPSIGAEHLNSFGKFNFGNMRFIPKEFYQGMTKGKIQKQDVLVVKDGATTGKVSFVGNDFPYNYAAINEHVFRLRGKDFLKQEFLFWFLYSPLGQAQIQQEFHGAAQGGINQQFAKGVYIQIPPLSIQQRIVTELQEKMAEAEKLCTAIENQLEAINALPQAILKKAFRGEL